MTAIKFEAPLQSTVLGLIVEVFATDDALERLKHPIPEEAAQQLAVLVADNLREKMGVSDLTTVVAAGLLQEPALVDDDLDIITAFESAAEQFAASHKTPRCIALTEQNGGLPAIAFPAPDTANSENVSNIGFCLPIAVVGTAESIMQFEEVFFQEDMEHLHFASDAVVLGLTSALGLEQGLLTSVGYEDLDYAAEALATHNTHAKMIEINHAVKHKRKVYYSIRSVPVFVCDGKVRVGFFSFDSFAKRVPHLQPDEGLEDRYAKFMKDFRFVVDILGDEGIKPILIHFPSPTIETNWDAVTAAPKLNELYVELAAPGLFEPAEGPAVGLDVVCMLDPEDGALLAATMVELNEDDRPLKQTNIYPLSADAVDVVLEYTKAVGLRADLDLSVTQGTGLYVDKTLRVLSCPPLEPKSLEEVTASKTLH